MLKVMSGSLMRWWSAFDPLEKVLLGKYHLAYQRGKGSRKIGPILIPVDVVDALKLLVEVRP